MDNFLKNTAILLQARLKSCRMPGKALVNLHGKPIVVHAMERLNVIPADLRVLVTSYDSEFELKPLALDTGWKVFAGDEQNVLKRFVDAIEYYDIEVVIRATADNPLVSTEIANKTLELFNKGKCDYARLEPIPYGSGIEVIRSKALISALENTKTPYYLEHVAPYIYEHKDKYKLLISNFYDKEVERPDVKLSIDTVYDFEKMNYLYRNLGKSINSLKIKNIIHAWDKLKEDKFRRILFITAFDGSFGMGHINRVKMLAKKLSDTFNIYVALKSGESYNLKKFFDCEVKFLEYDSLQAFVDEEGLFERVIVDVRDTGIEEMQDYRDLGTVITFDNMGPGSNISEIVIKTLPVIALHKDRLYNFDGLRYLFTSVKPGNNDDTPIEKPKKILVTFGGSDPADLTRPVLKNFQNLDNYEVKVILGPYYKHSIKNSDQYDIEKNVFDLQPYIENADIVITSFGMTLMESLILKKPVIIINPTEYHEKLTEDFTYPYLIHKDFKHGVPSVSSRDLSNCIDRMIDDGVFSDHNNSPLNKFFNMGIGEGVSEISDFIRSMTAFQCRCPYCSKKNEKPIWRSSLWNMYQCSGCGLMYIIPLNNEPKKYNDNYFTEEYKQTYGKTYEEDKENIREFAARRFETIKKFVSGGKLLDFGSGMGFFAEYCEEKGFETLSLDLSEYAVNYIKNTLKLPACNAGYEYLERNNDLFDVITSFYVIEHIKNFDKLIFLFACHLKKNGLLVLSTPNASGVSVRYNFLQYVKVHPEDHFSIFSPGFMKKVLKKYGFTDIKVVVTGIHIDRFLKNKKLANNKFIARIIRFGATLFGLGDTFEIYARKK